MIFLGCDGGSTKTEWLLADETGRVLSHRTFAGCNYAFLGEEGFRDLMASSVQALLDDGKITADQVTSAMLSLTVYGEVPGTEESFPRILGEILPGCPIQIANDSVAGWGGSLAGRPGINIVAGTGSVAYGEDQAGNACRVGGWSLFFADEGSCSWVARQLITEFVKQADGRHPRSAVYEELRREMGLTHDLYFSGYLQTEIRQNSALLAKLQLVALRAAQQGGSGGAGHLPPGGGGADGDGRRHPPAAGLPRRGAGAGLLLRRPVPGGGDHHGSLPRLHGAGGLHPGAAQVQPGAGRADPGGPGPSLPGGERRHGRPGGRAALSPPGTFQRDMRRSSG